MSPPQIPSIRTQMTDAQAYGRDAARSAQTLARELENTAAWLRQTSERLLRGDGKASRAAADIVSEYTQRVAGGTRLSSLVSSAADADRCFHAEQVEEGE